MKKTYLVTGGQGFIGKAVSLSLLEKNQDARRLLFSSDLNN